MTARLLVHAHVPRAGGGQLNHRLLFRSYARPQSLLVYGDRHARQAHADADGAPGGSIAGRRFAAGTVPYGYFDGLGAWTTYVSVFSEPVERFVRFLDMLLSPPVASEAANEAGADIPADTPGPMCADEARNRARDDPDRFALDMLARPEVRRRQLGAMTRIAAGHPLHAARESDAGLLNAARANLHRTNYIVGVRECVGDFVEELESLLGLRPSVQDPAELGWDGAFGPAPRTEPVLVRADLRPATLDAIAAANDADLRLYEVAATRRLTDRRACGF